MECPVCHQPAELACKSCLKVTYCSPEHQKEHWKVHKLECPCFRIEPSEIKALGKQAVATRNLKAGAIVLDEPACLQAPQWEHPSFESAATFPCISCGMEMDGESFHLCSICNWPVCGLQCEKDPVHEENECKVFAAHVPFPPPEDIKPADVSMCILMLRGIGLKNRHVEQWSQIESLQHEPGNITKLSERAQTVEKYIEILKKLLPTEAVDEHTCRRIIELADINGFTVRLEEPPAINVRFRTNVYVYLQASRFNHSCSPNCTWTVGPAPTNKIRIRTAVPVKDGEPLTISYLMRRNMFGTIKRQAFLREFGFTCRCARCLDPTELGSYLSAMTCKACKPKESTNNNEGYLLPVDPLDPSTLAQWKCNGCGNTSKASELLPTVDRIHSIIEKNMYSASELSSRCAEFSLFVIAKYKGTMLHPNHWLLGEATRAIERTYTASLETIDVTGLDRYSDYCLYLINIEGHVNPGITPGGAHLQRNILKALAFKISKFGKDLSRDDVSTTLARCSELYPEARKYFIDDPPSRGELVNRYVQELDEAYELTKTECAILLAE